MDYQALDTFLAPHHNADIDGDLCEYVEGSFGQNIFISASLIADDQTDSLWVAANIYNTADNDVCCIIEGDYEAPGFPEGWKELRILPQPFSHSTFRMIPRAIFDAAIITLMTSQGRP